MLRARAEKISAPHEKNARSSGRHVDCRIQGKMLHIKRYSKALRWIQTSPDRPFAFPDSNLITVHLKPLRWRRTKRD